MALGLAFLALGGSQARAPMWGHLALGLSALAQGQTRTPRGAEVFAPLPGLMGPASGLNFLRSFVRTKAIRFEFLNIIFSHINIIVFIIVESINIKHIIICVLNIICSIEIKIIIFIPQK